MKLLIVTQKVDINDPILGFFHRWIIEFAKHFESIVVICLELGIYELPENVRVLSLGKENKVSRMSYIRNFYSYIWRERKNYDAVFVHMNQEYVILAGWLWRMWNKKVTMWRNHHSGSFLTDAAAFFCNKVFCTSRYSYTAKYTKTVLMPVGVDLENFSPQQGIVREKNSILFLGRFAPSKHPDLLIEALKILDDEKIDYKASIYGDPIESDQKYYESIKQRVLKYGLGSRIHFFRGVPNHETPKIYSAHEVCVNLSSNGMYDKTIFEAMACGCLILASNDNLRGQIDDDFIFRQGDQIELAKKLTKLLNLDATEKEKKRQSLAEFAKKHSLVCSADALFENID